MPIIKSGDLQKKITEIEKELPPTLTDAEIEELRFEAAKNLTEDQTDFVKYYLATNNATEAIKKLRDIKEGEAPKSLATRAWQMRHNVNVIRAVMVEKMAIMARLKLRPERILQEAATLALSNISDFVDVDSDGKISLKSFNDIPYELKGAVKKLKETKDGWELELYDKSSALMKLAEYAGIFRGDPIDDALRKTLGNLVQKAMELDDRIQAEIQMEENVDYSVSHPDE